MIRIRELSEADREAWLPLWQGYLTFYGTSVSQAVTDETWRRLLDPDHTITGLLACDAAGRPVGMVHYLFHPVTWSVGDRCYLEDLFVSEDARGTGAGRALILAVKEKAVEAGADQLYWLTQDFNEAARALYDKVADKTPFIKYAVSPLS